MAVLASCPHSLDGRTIDPKSCNPRSMQKPRRTTTTTSFLPKVFLGGLPSSITETDLRTFFSSYGEVCEVVIMYDQEKKKSRGFGFLSFADEAACNRAVSDHYVTIQNKKVEVKRAEPRTNNGGGDHPVASLPSSGSGCSGSSPDYWLQQPQQVNYGVPPPLPALASPVPQGGWAVPAQPPPPPTTCVYSSPPPVNIPPHTFWPPVATPPPAPAVDFTQKWGFTASASVYQQYQAPAGVANLSGTQPILLASPPPPKLPYPNPSQLGGGGEFYSHPPGHVFGQAEFITSGGLGPQRITTNYASSQPLSQVQSYHPYRRS